MHRYRSYKIYRLTLQYQHNLTAHYSDVEASDISTRMNRSTIKELAYGLAPVFLTLAPFAQCDHLQTKRHQLQMHRERLQNDSCAAQQE